MKASSNRPSLPRSGNRSAATEPVKLPGKPQHSGLTMQNRKNARRPLDNGIARVGQPNLFDEVRAVQGDANYVEDDTQTQPKGAAR